MKYLIALSLLLSQVSQANDSAAAAATVLLLFGAARGAEHHIYSGRWPNELGDWKSQQTQVTAEIVEQCNFLVEGRLLGTNRFNMLMLITKNLEKEVKLKPQDIEFEFENGVVRRGQVDLDTEYTIKKDGKYIIVIPFPRKDDFANQNKLSIAIPFTAEGKDCVGKLVFDRPKEVTPLISTSTRMTTLDTELSIGTASNSGNLKKYLGDQSGLFRLQINVIGQNQHGGYFGFGAPNENDVEPSDLATTGLPITTAKASMTYFDFGYAYRQILARRSFIYYRAGVAFNSLRIRDEVGDTGFNESGSGIHGQILYSRTFAQVDHGVWMGDYTWNVGFDGRYIFSGDIGKDNFTGSQLGIIGSLTVGL